MNFKMCGYPLVAFVSLAASNYAVLKAQPNPGDFVGITPCRVVDTRGATGTFGGPIITGGTTRVFPIPSGPCAGIPSNATGYALNIAAVPPGGLGYITVWPDGQAQPFTSVLNDSTGLVLSNAITVAAGNNGAIDVFVSNTTHVVIDIYGYYMAQSDTNSDTALGTYTLSGNTGFGNSGFGYNSLSSSTSGSFNTATGAYVLTYNTTGSENTALGYASLYNNTTGSYNTALGYYDLEANTSGTDNSAVGYAALAANSNGSYNTAIGDSSLAALTSGNYNTALGFSTLSASTVDYYNTALGFQSLSSENGGGSNVAVGADALYYLTTGSNNVAVGLNAGLNVVTGSYNIDIGTPTSSLADESYTIRIGDASTQTSTYIAGIYGANVGSGATVIINSAGQLGTVTSSRRYKDDIHDMGESSDALMQLRPVSFHYKQAAPDGSNPLEYGLIAEEVAKVYPELVVKGRDGQVESVQYHQLPAMLLNELQKQHKMIDELQAEVAALKALLNAKAESTDSAGH